MSCQTDPVALPGINSIGLYDLSKISNDKHTVNYCTISGLFCVCGGMLQLVEFTTEEEFAKLDRKYAELSDEFKSKMVIEERLLSYQHQLDERARTEIKLEVPETSETNETIPSFTYHNCNLV